MGQPRRLGLGRGLTRFRTITMTAPKDAPWETLETRFEPIHSAARMCDAQTVEQELDAGVEVDVVNGRAANGDGAVDDHFTTLELPIVRRGLSR